MEVLIRPFRSNDWDGVFFLGRSCFEPPYRLEYPRLRALIEDPGAIVVVIEAKGQDEQGEEETALVGGLLLREEPGAGQLVLIGVMIDPGFRRVGLGRRLVGWAEKIARSRSLGKLLAPLEAENGSGSAFLEALGFVQEPGAPPFFEDAAGGSLWRRTVARTPAAPAPAPAAQSPATEPGSLSAEGLAPLPETGAKEAKDPP